MPAPAPPLDTRTFEDLVREARLRIPRYTREWTDFNDSDPGMALVQLFAWFTEQMLVQFNAVPERNRLAFLDLLNLRPTPARPATVRVTFTPQGGAKSKSVPLGTQMPATGANGDAVTFETTEALDLVPHPLQALQVFNGADYEVRTDENSRTDRSFPPFGNYPQVGNALYLGLGPVAPDDETADFPTRWKLSAFLPAEDTPAPLASDEPQIVWEFMPKGQAGVWRPLEARDTTKGLTRAGDVILSRPDNIVPAIIGKVAEPLFWVRARIAARPHPPGSAPRIAFLRTNTAPVQNLVTVRNEELQPCDGDQRYFSLQNSPVAPGSLKLVLEVDGRDDEEWTEVPDFFGADVGRDSPVYTLDPSTGAIQTGDGRKGRIPEPGGRLVARAYRFGGGAAGNIEAGALSTAPADLDAYDARNERAAAGGQDPETVEATAARAPLLLRSRGQAVTERDFQQIAEMVAGVARAVVRPCTHPDFPGATVPGAVTVVVVPTDGRQNPVAPPDPTPQLLEAVATELDRVRLIGTELVVTRPRYVRLSVDVTAVAMAGVAASEVEQLVTRRVLAALRPPPGSSRLAVPGTEIDPPVRPAPGPGETFYPSSLYEVVLSATDQRKQRLVSVVTALTVRGAKGDILPDALPLGPDEVLWCETVTVQPPPLEGRA